MFAVFCADWDYPSYRINSERRNQRIMRKRQPIRYVVFSFKFPIFPCCSLLLWGMENTSYFCRLKRAVRRKTIRNYKQNNNKTMGYFIITDSNWARLRNEILSLAETCHKAFGEQSKHTDWLHNGDVCKLLNISKRTLQHYRDTGVLPFSQIGHKCYYKREDVDRLLETKSVKSNTNKSKSNK